MKTKSLISAIVLSAICFTSDATPAINVAAPVIIKNGGFDAFHAHRQQEGIALSWKYSTTFVTTFVIEHSFDGGNFVAIAEVAPDFNGWNNYKDDGCFPGYNYYRIGARFSDGSIDYSDVKMVRIVQRK